MPGNINAADMATLFLDGMPVAQCRDTPNAIAYGMKKSGAVRAVGFLGVTMRHDLEDRVEYAGWMKSDKEASYSVI